jgi:hypothetical protein
MSIKEHSGLSQGRREGHREKARGWRGIRGYSAKKNKSITIRIGRVLGS